MVPGLTIGGLFALTRRAAREERMEEIRYHTQMMRSQQGERAAQDRSLARMREVSSAQLGSTLMDRGVHPMALMGQRLSSDSPTAAAYVAQAAASGRRG